MKLFKTAAAAILGLAMMTGVASAQSAMNFEFEENGSASGEFEMNFSESSETTWTGGSEYMSRSELARGSAAGACDCTMYCMHRYQRLHATAAMMSSRLCGRAVDLGGWRGW